jgi:hypothetical protein
VPPLLGISSAALELGQAKEARQAAERSIKILASFDGDPRMIARTKEALALALAAASSTPAERARSRALMHESLTMFDSLGPSTARDAARIRAWLDGR